MTIHNILKDVTVICPHCKKFTNGDIEIYVGYGNLMEYRIGNKIEWVQRKSFQKGGRPANGNIDIEGYTECEKCGLDFFLIVRIRDDCIYQTIVDHDKKGFKDGE